jgi:hypothetical protein
MALLSRTHADGWAPDLLPLVVTLVLFASVSAAGWAKGLDSSALRHGLLASAMIAQYALLLGRVPHNLSNGDEEVVANKAFHKRVLEPLSDKGKVWVISHGHQTAEPRPHLAALLGVMRGEEKSLPAPLYDALRDQKFAAIVVDDLGLLPRELGKVIEASYSLSDRIEIGPWVRTDFLPHPQWIFKPRPRRLSDLTATSTLAQRATAESLLAVIVARMRAENFPNMDGATRMDLTARRLFEALDRPDHALADSLCRSLLDRELCRALWRYVRRKTAALPAERLDALRELWGTMAEERASWILERKALVDEITCLRTSLAAGEGAPERCFTVTGGASPAP